MESSLTSIFFITIGILFVPFFSKILRIPVSVGEVIYGILIGKTCCCGPLNHWTLDGGD